MLEGIFSLGPITRSRAHLRWFFNCVSSSVSSHPPQRAYRAFYILNWIYRYLTEQRFTRWISCVSGLVQTALYADFFYYYFISWKNNAKLQLPA